MTLVVDASVGVKWFLAEALHGEARALLLGDEAILAPDLFLPEVANVLWRKQRNGELERDEVGQILAALTAGTPEVRSSAADLPAAVDLASLLDHPVYDCLYLALAVRVGAVLVTADDRFHGKVASSRHRGRTRALGSGGSA